MSEFVNTAAVKTYLLDLQTRICEGLADLEPEQTFHEDRWERLQGGGGQSRVLTEGQIFEQAGVNFSHVHGDHLPPTATERRPELAGRSFQALGVSLVIHPRNPYVPTSHANVRFFVADAPNAPPIWWFGGGFDLTPFYPFKADCQHWHRVARDAVTPFGKALYPRFKKWCDDYFYLPHRKEARGIGGLFFDDYDAGGFDAAFGLMQAVGNAYLPAYLPIVQARHATPFSEREREFQLYRRGRYVEFNLLYDRGTRFGIQSGGRTESILMSMPPLARWEYGYTAEPGSPEAELTQDYLIPQQWV